MTKIKGLNELQKQFDKMSKAAKELERTNEVEFGDLFPDKFISKHTKFRTLEELFKNSSFKVDSQEDFEKIPDDKWDVFISNNTDFDSWEDMMGEAAGSYAARKMGFEE